MRTLVLLLLLTLSAHAWIDDHPLPTIPRTSRILTIEDVETYWFNVLRRTKIPRRPSALHPEQQKQWDAKIAQFKSRLRQILDGHFQHEADVAMLQHNIVAWQRKGDLEESRKCRAELQALLEHRARMETLAQQRRAASQMAESSTRQARALEDLADDDDCEPRVVVQEVEPCPPPVIHVHPTPAPAPRPAPQRVVPSFPIPDPPQRPFCPVRSP